MPPTGSSVVWPYLDGRVSEDDAVEAVAFVEREASILWLMVEDDEVLAAEGGDVYLQHNKTNRYKSRTPLLMHME